jgi:hypothetical protein
MVMDFNSLLSNRGNCSINATIPSGKELRIETSPDGEELGSGTVPAGKKWVVNISVFIEIQDE